MTENTKEETTKALITASAKGIDEIVLAGLPDGFDHRKIARQRYQGATWELWSYDGVPFLELHDIECSTTEWDGVSNMKINVVMKYRYLTHQPSSQVPAEDPDKRGDM